MEEIGPGWIAAIAVLIGASAPVLSKFIISYFTSKRKTTLARMEAEFRELRAERTALQHKASAICDDLQRQIFSMREQVMMLQKDNIAYVQENAELRVQIKALLEANTDLKTRVVELETEVRQLRSTRGITECE